MKGVVRWLVISAFVIATVGNSVVTVLIWNEQKASKYRLVYSACLERNKTNQGIQDYLGRLGTDGKALREARRVFPVRGSCRAYTLALLGPHAPGSAFNLPVAQQPPG